MAAVCISPGTSINVSLGDRSGYWWSWDFNFLFFFLFLLGVFYCPSYAIYFWKLVCDLRFRFTQGRSCPVSRSRADRDRGWPLFFVNVGVFVSLMQVARACLSGMERDFPFRSRWLTGVEMDDKPSCLLKLNSFVLREMYCRSIVCPTWRSWSLRLWMTKQLRSKFGGSVEGVLGKGVNLDIPRK